MTDRERPALRNIGAAVFDLDGTLFDSTKLWYDIDEKFLSARGKTPTTEYKRGIAALGNRDAALFTIKYYGLTDTVDSLTAEWADMALYEYAHNISLIKGAREYLEEVAARGITVTAVTSLARELAEPCLKNNGIYGFFKEVFTADETRLNKLSPDIYIYACKAVAVEPSRAVAFDDVAAAIRSAKLAGLTTVAVKGSRHYADGEEVFDETADYAVEDMTHAPVLMPD